MHVQTSKDQNNQSIIQMLKDILQKEGVAGFYKGIESKLAQSVLTSALLFAFKEQFYAYAQWLLLFLKLRIAKK